MATVGLLYNLGKYDPPEEGEPPDINAELDGEQTVMAIAEALKWGGHETVFLEGDESAFYRLKNSKIDIAFNICEGLHGESRESHIPAMLEMLGIPYTGSGVLTLALSLDKPMAKKVFAFHGVPTPKFRVFNSGDPITSEGMCFPLFVKPAHEGSSMGVSPNSVVRDEYELCFQVDYVRRFYKQAALVEEFLEGREFTVGILGNKDPFALPIREILFDRVPKEHGAVYSRQFKVEFEDEDTFYACPANVTPEEAQSIRSAAIAAFKAIDCRDVGRVDVRLNRAGVPNVLEINPLPGLTPHFSDLCRAAEVAGISYNWLVCGILEAAIERYGLTHLSSRALEVHALLQTA
ncbi:MAG: ATP-grasp domain-containing protein [Firmicutes bacterium]|nr:ATP-grasp domain-containing protein [Bacillota bacterium]